MAKPRPTKEECLPRNNIKENLNYYEICLTVHQNVTKFIISRPNDVIEEGEDCLKIILFLSNQIASKNTSN
jgi:hypothetical protein